MLSKTMLISSIWAVFGIASFLVYCFLDRIDKYLHPLKSLIRALWNFRRSLDKRTSKS